MFSALSVFLPQKTRNSLVRSSNVVSDACYFVVTHPLEAITVGLAAQSTVTMALGVSPTVTPLSSPLSAGMPSLSKANELGSRLSNAQAFFDIQNTALSFKENRLSEINHYAIAEIFSEAVASKILLKSTTEFQINTYTHSDQANPSVSALINGGFVVTWQSNSQDGDVLDVYGQRYDASGLTEGTEFRINTYTNDYQLHSSVAALVDGGFVVTWESGSQDGSSYGVYGQRYDAISLPIGNEFQINTYTNANQGYPSVATFANGGFLVTWRSYGQDGSGWDIYGQRYDAAALPLGNEFKVNSYVSNDQDNPSVAALVDGGFVVTWVSVGQDGSGDGIYGRLYLPSDFSESTTPRSRVAPIGALIGIIGALGLAGIGYVFFKKGYHKPKAVNSAPYKVFPDSYNNQCESVFSPTSVEFCIIQPNRNSPSSVNDTGIAVLEKKLDRKPASQRSIFITYQWAQQSIAQALHLAFEAKGYLVIRDESHLEYGVYLPGFMKIIAHRNLDYVLPVISESYLKSKSCMYEVNQVMRRYQWEKTLLPYVVSDPSANPKIYGSGLGPYLEYWTQEYEQESDPVERTVIQKIQLNIRDFVTVIANRINIPEEELIATQYQALFDMIKKLERPNFEEIQELLRSASISESLLQQVEAQNDFEKAIEKLKTMKHLDGIQVMFAKAYGLYGEYLLRQNERTEGGEKLDIAVKFGWVLTHLRTDSLNIVQVVNSSIDETPIIATASTNVPAKESIGDNVLIFRPIQQSTATVFVSVQGDSQELSQFLRPGG